MGFFPPPAFTDLANQEFLNSKAILSWERSQSTQHLVEMYKVVSTKRLCRYQFLINYTLVETTEEK